MRRFRLWLAYHLLPAGTFVDKRRATFNPGNTFTTCSSAVWYPKAERMFKYENGEITEVDMGKKKARSKAKGKAAAKNKQENRQKAKGGKGAR